MCSAIRARRALTEDELRPTVVVAYTLSVSSDKKELLIKAKCGYYWGYNTMYYSDFSILLQDWSKVLVEKNSYVNPETGESKTLEQGEGSGALDLISTDGSINGAVRSGETATIRIIGDSTSIILWDEKAWYSIDFKQARFTAVAEVKAGKVLKELSLGNGFMVRRRALTDPGIENLDFFFHRKFMIDDSSKVCHVQKEIAHFLTGGRGSIHNLEIEIRDWKDYEKRAWRIDPEEGYERDIDKALSAFETASPVDLETVDPASIEFQDAYDGRIIKISILDNGTFSVIVDCDYAVLRVDFHSAQWTASAECVPPGSYQDVDWCFAS